jgi:exonuclease III
MANDLTVISLNCRGLNDAGKRRDVFHYLREKSYNIYFLQDIHITDKMVSYVTSEWGYQAYFSPFRSNSRGVCILFQNNFEFKVERVIKADDGNSLIVIIQFKGEEFTLVNIYGPNSDEPVYFHTLKDKIKNFKNIIMGGDFNLVLDAAKDYHNYRNINHPNAREAVHALSQELELCDIWRELNPERLRYTWRRTNPHLQQSRLDFFLISEQLVTKTHHADIKYGYKSDHSMITLTLRFSDEKIERKTFWKFCNAHLKDSKYLDEINQVIRNVVSEYALTPYARFNVENIPWAEIQFNISDDTFLDFLLVKIREKTIAYATMKKKKTNEEEKKLIKEIDTLESMVKNIADSVTFEEKKAQLQEIREKRMEGVLIRSRARYVADGEKPSKYFCSLEKRNYVSKTMTQIIKDDGSVLSKTKDISKEAGAFYESLYKKRQVINCEIGEIVRQVPHITEGESRNMEGLLTFEEAGRTLAKMPNFKSPGSDGFTVEFFKIFWGKLGHFVVRALNTSFHKGELSNVQKEGIITCLPKGDKSRDFLKNWRPISLLNVIYKIGSACIANRIKTVLPTLVSDDQTGFMSGRYMGDNLRLIYDTIAYLDEQNLPGLLLNIDFEKAFDSLDWSFMFKVLRAFGFGEDICRWISTFYNNIKSAVIINGTISPWFSVNRGCRQGDPISPYLFIICVEVLGIMTRENAEIKGIVINQEEHKLSQYADDTEFLLDGNRRSFEACVETINRFSLRSGLFMNNRKTSAIWLGSRKNSQVRYLQHMGMEWNPDRFKILGVWFTNDLSDCVVLNFREKYEEIRRTILLWTKRSITPVGRVAILKSLILSKLTHLWLLLPNPPGYFTKNLQKLCYDFVWNGKPDKISRKMVHNPVEKGGIGLPNLEHFEMSLKITWIRKFIHTEHKWKNVILQGFPLIANMNNFGPEITSRYQGNPFWKDVFKAYKTFFYKVKPRTAEEILSEPICFNDRLKHGNRTIKNRMLQDKDIFKIGHFLKENGQFLSNREFSQKYELNINFLTYLGWRQTINQYITRSNLRIYDNSFEDMNACHKLIIRNKKGCKEIYNVLNLNADRPNCCTKWEQKINVEINWNSCFYNIKKISEVNMKWFQLRIVHRVLGTNIVLSHIGVANNQNCSYCTTIKDSIDHIFWDCPVAQQFWEHYNTLVRNKCLNAHNMRLSKCLIVLGIDNNIIIDRTMYFIIMLAKQYLYKCKLDSSIPDIEVFRKRLRWRYNIEEYNAKLRQKHAKFKVDWVIYKELCSQ